jgi:hypothetical protein
MKKSAVDWFQEQILKIVEGKCELSEIEIYNKAKQMEENSNNLKYLTGNLIGILAGIAIGFLMFG